jgi:hypothetical protein
VCRCVSERVYKRSCRHVLRVCKYLRKYVSVLLQREYMYDSVSMHVHVCVCVCMRLCVCVHVSMRVLAHLVLEVIVLLEEVLCLLTEVVELRRRHCESAIKSSV